MENTVLCDWCEDNVPTRQFHKHFQKCAGQFLNEQKNRNYTNANNISKSVPKESFIFEHFISDDNIVPDYENDYYNQIYDYENYINDIDRVYVSLCHDNISSSFHCPICYKTLLNNSKTYSFKIVRIKNCNHMFCQYCIDEWILKRNENCPLCRTKFNKEQYKNTLRLIQLKQNGIY